MSNFYGATTLIGGGFGALDVIDGADLADLDGAVVITDGKTYLMHLDATSGAGESPPDIISPDTNPGTKRWTLNKLICAGVGIGTDDPNAPLEVKGSLPGSIGGFTSGHLHVTGDGSTEFSGSAITGHNSFNTNTQLWRLGSTSESGDNDIAFINRQNAKMHFKTNNVNRVTIDANGNVTFSVIAAESSDVDKFLVSSAGVIKFRTGDEVLSDIGMDTSDTVQFAALKLGTANLKSGALLELAKDSANAEMVVSCYTNGQTQGGVLTLRRADGSEASPALIDNADRIGFIRFDGYDGSGWHTAAQIEGRVGGATSDGTDMPGSLHFWTTPDGSATLVERFYITSDGGAFFKKALFCDGGASVVNVLLLSGATTTAQTMTIQNSGVICEFGLSASDGSGMFGSVRASEYQGMIGTSTSDAFHIGTNNIVRITVLSDGKVGIADNNPAEILDVTGNINVTGAYKVDDVQVVGNRIIDARCDDAINSGDVTTDGVIDSLRDAMITHGLLAAA